MNELGPKVATKISQRTTFECQEVAAKLPRTATMPRLIWAIAKLATEVSPSFEPIPSVCVVVAPAMVIGQSREEEKRERRNGREEREGRKEKEKRIKEIRGVGHVSCLDLGLFPNFQKLHVNPNFPLNFILATECHKFSHFGTFKNSILTTNLEKIINLIHVKITILPFKYMGFYILSSLNKFRPQNLDYGTSTN